ncbi:metal ABC transporter ATP-binding protein [Azonexus sp.]|uniref:metal ABC transporter ATP-binding protein n=1 Tax=Azonexus sp. TaxID=1872668 RepID=UPI0035B04FF2
MSVTPAIVLDHLSFARGEQTVLDDLNATLSSDDFVVLVGPNGAGKSTLLHLILGLLTPTGGSVALLGGAPAATRAAVGYVPQHGRFDRRFPIDVGGMVLQGRQPPGWHPGWRPTAADQAAVDEALARCGIAALSRRRLGALSGGEMQRALIARALAGKPRLLLLDEPTASIDPAGQEALYALLGELNRQMPLLVVSHDLSLISRQAHRVWCLNRRLHVHPALELTAQTLASLYGFPVRAVDHRSDHAEAA